MKIAVIGGAGMMGRITIWDLHECPEVEKVLVADVNEKNAQKLAAKFNDPRIEGCFVDASNIDETAKLIEGYDAVINAAFYTANIPIMQACLKAGCHYCDLGGLFHNTLKQLKLFDDFKNAGLNAVLCVGSAPGITNMLAAYGADRLDEVDTIKVYCATANKTDMKGIDVFFPPYSIVTIMEEFSEDTYQFMDGDHKVLPAMSGKEAVDFPEPIGQVDCFHTIHSEPATLPIYYKEKGVKEVSWRLGLFNEFTEKARLLASIGFASKEPVKVNDIEVAPLDVLGAVVQKQVGEKLTGVKLDHKIWAIFRGHSIGKKDGKPMEIIADCIVGLHSRWKTICATSVPPSIVAQMQAKGMIKEPGVWGPEKVVDQEHFFKELAKREMEIQVTQKEIFS
jgi:saccharopine dehydrogenase-like NADP-dependent oxidoreductase